MARAHLAKLNEFADAGFDHVCVHQVGPDQEAFFCFHARRKFSRKFTRRRRRSLRSSTAETASDSQNNQRGESLRRLGRIMLPGPAIPSPAFGV